jgi:hypothetical protein
MSITIIHFITMVDATSSSTTSLHAHHRYTLSKTPLLPLPQHQPTPQTKHTPKMCIQRTLTHTACLHTYTSTIHTPNCPFHTSSSTTGTSSRNKSQRLTARIPLVDDTHSIPNLLGQRGKYDMVDEQGRTIEVEILKAVVKEGVCWACERKES